MPQTDTSLGGAPLTKISKAYFCQIFFFEIATVAAAADTSLLSPSKGYGQVIHTIGAHSPNNRRGRRKREMCSKPATATLD